MKLSRILSRLTLFAMLGAMLFACSKDIVILAHEECTLLEVGEKNMGDLTVDGTVKATIKGFGSTPVEWTNADGVAITDTIWGEDAEDGDTWHLYLDHGSFKLPSEGGIDPTTPAENDSEEEGDTEEADGDTEEADGDTEEADGDTE